MISVVCVYNNEAILKVALLRSLECQTAKHELILLDNRDSRYKSAAQALNDGGARTTGEYIMFVHQDMWLASDTWLEDAENILKTLPDLGLAGVAGVTASGHNWYDRIRYSIGGLENQARAIHGRVQSAAKVQTLDECLLIVPRSVFDRLKFDEDLFDGWDCYGADYCLTAKDLGMKAYVIPPSCNHCCSRASYPVWHFKDLFKYQKRLYQKHRSSYKRIYTWTGDISWLQLVMRSTIGVLGPLYMGLFPNIFALMKKELAGCDTVLDLGCGSHSPIQVCQIPFSVGVEIFRPSLAESRRTGIHSQYILADVRSIDFQPKSFDAVVALEVLEHMTRDEGLDLLRHMEQWAKRKVVITTPNGFVWQDAYDNNPGQEHKYGWKPQELRSLGFKVRGIGGWKQLKGYRGQMKYQPAFLWERIADITDLVTRRLPGMSFGLMAVKRTDRKK